MAKNWVYTDLSVKDALTLTIAGRDYQVTQFSASYAVNEVPTAVCMLAIGRDVRTLKKATVHSSGRPKQITKATVKFHPRGEYGIRAAGLLGRQVLKWPEEAQVIFDGYLTGFAFRKINGKVSIVANLVHWLAAMGFSSCVTKGGHVSNPTALNVAAVLESLKATTGAGMGHMLPESVLAEILVETLEQDLWASVKNVFCKLADLPTMPTGPEAACVGGGTFGKNDFALNALSRIEGPAGSEAEGAGLGAVAGGLGAAAAGGCSMAYKYGVPLSIEALGVHPLVDNIARSLGSETVASYAGTTFWDKLIGQFCPMFGMAVVPMAESAIVIADVPAFSGGPWKTINPIDYDGFDMSSELFRPLRAVGVIVDWDSVTKAGIVSANSAKAEMPPNLGGCYVEDSVEPGDGMVLYVSPPPWLASLDPRIYAGDTSGVIDESPIKSATIFGIPLKPAVDRSTLGIQANVLYAKYAQMVYASQALRGRGGSASGKLRFDVAPGSIVRVNASTEKFIGAEDDLAVPQIGCVQRVGITINAEAAMAGTTFVFSHLRDLEENSLPRASVSEHPLFGKAIHGSGTHGCPIVAAYDIR